MISIKSSLAGLVLTGILAMMPAAAFAHGGGGGGGGGHAGGGGGHGFGGAGFTGGRGAVGFAGRFNGRGVNSVVSGTRGFSTRGSFGRRDHDRFGDRGFRGRDRDFHDRRFRDSDRAFFDFGGDFGYPDYSYYDPYSYDNDDGYLSVERAVQEELAELG